MIKTNKEDSEPHLYENTCQEVPMTRTHQEDGRAHVYETPYQTGIVMNNTHRQEMKDKNHLETVDDAEDQIPLYDCEAHKRWTKENHTKRLAVTTIASELKGGGGHS